jgi:hypothetical protein
VKASPDFDLIRFLKEAEARPIRFLLIGRWAVAQHGAPVVTADYDFWVDPAHHQRFLDLLVDAFDAELPPREQWHQPLISAYVGPDKVDCFSPRRLVNEEGQELVFKEVYARSEIKHDAADGLTFHIPSVDDLIALKKLTSNDPLKRARNLEDIRYLLTLKSDPSGE